MRTANRTPAGPSTAAAEPPAAVTVPRGCTSLKLRQLARRVGRDYDTHLGAAGLKTTQFSLLSHIVKLGPLRPGVLAGRMEMDASTLTRNLQPLVARGCVVLGPGEDGRSRCVAATGAGRAKLAAARQDWKRAQAALDARLGPERVARLHALLDDCLELLGPLTGERDE